MIRNLKEMGMSNREIARQLDISSNTVSRMLRKTRIQEKKKRHRGSKLDPYRENIRSLIDEHNLSAVRILEEIRKFGYDGGYTILKDYCHELRKDRRIQAVYRYETEPGKQSQVDFGEFGYIDMDGKRRKLY
ncbi:MAG: helix-turn-helix domain-containing protein, partial [Candidatus Thermoplasmatota archaeon]|nr:helix-turn-helix domain-containing protein [Candidatus Thermoplasmatota archaeon]